MNGRVAKAKARYVSLIMDFQLPITKEATDEMYKAFMWYETQSDGLGKKFFRDLENQLARIRNTPKIMHV